MTRRKAFVFGGIALVAGMLTATPAIASALGHTGASGTSSPQYLQTCDPGSIGGFAQVAADTPSGWTQVPGYGHTLLEGGPYPGLHRCTHRIASARQTSPGQYQVSFHATCGASIPSSDQTLPAVITVNSSQELLATYTTMCHPRRGFVENVTVRALDGTPTSAAFTIAELEPVTYLAP
jgi:hypothetical protein